MDDPQPVADVAAAAGSAGFVVSRRGNNIEVRIDAPAKDGTVFLAWLISIVILIPSFALLCAIVWTWSLSSENFDCCAMTVGPLLALVCFWQTLAAMRRIGRAHRLGSATTIGVVDGVVWCAPAIEPATRYVWPVVDIWRIEAIRARFSRGANLQIRSRRRPLVRLEIPGKHPVATEALTNILRHAIASATTPLTPVAQAQAAGDAGQPAQPATAPVIDYSSSDVLANWAVVGTYDRFSEWQDARAALSKIDLLARLETGSAVRADHYRLSVPISQAKAARDWLARPQEWTDRSCCPRCGANGEVLGFWTSLARCIRHPTRPPALGSDWRFCSECNKSYQASD